MKYIGQKGFSLVELLITIAIIGIVAAIAIPNFISYQRSYKFTDYASQIEYLIKYAKIYAMERTTNVGICVSGSELTVRNIGTSRSAGICSGSVVSTMTVPESYITIAGSGASFDPRGVAIWSGYVCVSYNNKYSKMCISKASLRKQEGSGGCSPCS